MNYKDFGKKGENLSDKEAVLRLIDNILGIRKDEVPFRRHLGSTIEDYLYEPYTFATSMLLMSAIKRES